MKRSPIQRKPRGPNPAGSDERYLAWVRRQPCCVCHQRPVEAHHLILTGKGMGMRTPDGWAIPLCPKDHADLHNFRGYFESFNKERRAKWQTDMSMMHRAYCPTKTETPDPWSEIF